MNNVVVCKKGRIYGLEFCEGEGHHDPDFLPQCSCKDQTECVNSDKNYRNSPEIFTADSQIQQ